MDSLRSERNQMQQLVAQQLGRNRRNPMDTSGNLRGEQQFTDLDALPIDGTNWVSRQITDPDDPDFGKKRFIVGISRLDGGDVFK